MERSAPATILVIDDDPDVLATLRAMLEAAGFEVRVAGSGRQAMADIGFHRPSLIITDIYMPGGDGFELITALRRDHPDVSVIAISGGAIHHHDHMEIARQLGAVATLEKPFRKEDLIETINRVIGEYARGNANGNDADGR